MILGIKPTGREAWTPVARHPDGRMRNMARSFPICRDADEALERVANRAMVDATFAAEYEDWTFYPMRLDRGIKLRKVAVA